MIEFTLRDFIKVLFKHKAVIFTTIITVMATVAIGLQFRTPIYESQVKILISAQKQIESQYYRELLGPSAIMAITQSEIVISNPVIERAVKVLNLHNRPLDYEKQFATPFKKALIDWRISQINEELNAIAPAEKQSFFYRMAVENLKSVLTVEPIRDTNIFVIKAQDFSQVGAAIVANVVSRSYVIFDLEQQLVELQLKYGDENLITKQLEDNIVSMKKGLNGGILPDSEAIGPASVKIIEQAIPSLKPRGIPNSITLLLAFVMSIFLGIMLAFIFDYTDQTFRSAQEIEQYLNIPLLGSIPKKAKFEVYQTIAEQIYLLLKDKNINSLLITAALPKEGVTTILTNLSKYLADKNGHKVLIIDANLRNPIISKNFNVSDKAGLIDVIEGKLSFDKAVVSISPNLSILPVAETELNPITLLESHKMQEIIKIGKERYEIVLIDCANLRGYKDAIIISPFIDGVILVVNDGKTRRQVVKSLLVQLEQRKINIAGALLNNRKFVIPKVLYDRF